MFDEIFTKFIDEKVAVAVSETLEPLEILRDYKSEVLTLEEMTEILRVDNPQIIRDAVKRGELPGIAFGRQISFPRYQVAQLLMGNWKPAKKKKDRAKMNPNVLSLQEKINNFVS